MVSSVYVCAACAVNSNQSHSHCHHSLSPAPRANCSTSLPLNPGSIAQFSKYFGITAFCFGVPPLQFTVQDSMHEPNRFLTSLAIGLSCVWVAYLGCGLGILRLYRCDPEGVHQNILMNLPTGSTFADVVRGSYALACVTSYPICLITVADTLIPEIGNLLRRFGHGAGGEYVPVEDVGSCDAGAGAHAFHFHPTPWLVKLVRGVLVAVTTTVAIAFPEFGLTLSLIGSFSVSLLSFVLPTMMALVPEAGSGTSVLAKVREHWVDALLTMLGIVVCIGTTFMTAASVVESKPILPPAAPSGPGVGH